MGNNLREGEHIRGEESRAIAALQQADAIVDVDLGALTVALPVPGHSRRKHTTSARPLLLLAVLIGLVVTCSPPAQVSMWLFLSLPLGAAVFLGEAWLRSRRLARRVRVVLSDRTIRLGEQELPLEELYAVITTPDRLLLERKGASGPAVVIPADPIAQPAMQSLLYAMARRRQAVARKEGHDPLSQGARPPAALDVLRGRR